MNQRNFQLHAVIKWAAFGRYSGGCLAAIRRRPHRFLLRVSLCASFLRGVKNEPVLWTDIIVAQLVIAANGNCLRGRWIRVQFVHSGIVSTDKPRWRAPVSVQLVGAQ
jgi:hypothetical protein